MANPFNPAWRWCAHSGILHPDWCIGDCAYRTAVVHQAWPCPHLIGENTADESCFGAKPRAAGLAAAPVTVGGAPGQRPAQLHAGGLADVEVKEARARALGADERGPGVPQQQAHHREPGPRRPAQGLGRFDLPIALGILAASGQIDAARLAGWEFAGELSLSGELRPVRGAWPPAWRCIGMGRADVRLVLPPGSAEEAALVPGAQVWRARHLLDVVQRSCPTAQPPALEDAATDGGGWAHAAPARRARRCPTWPT